MPKSAIVLNGSQNSVISRFDKLPPFWIAFALTLTETVGAGTLALPIAFASVGPLVGVALLIILGLVNLLTVSYLAEASTRSRSVRTGNAFIGKLVEDYLGGFASVVLRIALFLLCCMFLTAYYTGFASILSAATGLPEFLWVTVVFVFGLTLILRRTLTGTLAAAMVTGAINVSILLLLSVVALKHATLDNIIYMDLPVLNGQPFESSHIKLVFGIIMVSYFGHLSVSNCAKTVLERDPTGRSLKRGTVAAMLAAIVIYSIWTISVAGALGVEGLFGETGTALVPLAQKIGPGIYIFGVVFAVLGLGMSSIHFGLGIVNLTRELFDTKNANAGWLRKRTADFAAVLPIFLVFSYVQWSYYNGTSSFTAPLELVGVLLTPVLAGIFPVLLLMASRCKSYEPSHHPMSNTATHFWLLCTIVILSFSSLLLHGLLLWTDPIAQAAAMLVAGIMVVLIGDTIKRRSLSSITLYNRSIVVK